jgi:hypothetical protein
VLGLTVAVVGVAAGQQPLTNDAVIKMVKGRLGEELIVTVIEKQPGTFSVTPDELIRLKQAGVSDTILSAMIRKGGTPAPGPSLPKREEPTLPAGAALPKREEPPVAAGESLPKRYDLPNHPQGQPAASGGANTFFTTWHDPRENAFELGVPKGWKVTGGWIRKNAVDAGGVVRAQSPDGKIQIIIGDPNIQSYQTPGRASQMMGLREGQPVANGGSSVIISRFLSGSQFAQQFIRSTMCREAAVTDASELRELTIEMNSTLQAYSNQRFGAQFASQASAGDAEYRCGGGAGYVQATTLWIRAASVQAANAGAAWWVWRLGAYQVSDVQQSGLAYYVLNTMLETFKFDPRWSARNEQNVDAAAKASMKAQDDIAKKASDFAHGQASKASAGGYNHPNTGQLPQDLRKKWATEYNSLQKRGDAVSGTTWMHTANGDNVRVSNSSTNYWRNAAGDVIPGPESGSPPPGGGWEKLQQGWQ